MRLGKRCNKLIMLKVSGVLNLSERPEFDRLLVDQDARVLYKAGEKRWGTNKTTFRSIFSERSRVHLAAVSSTYRIRYGNTLRKVHIINRPYDEITMCFFNTVRTRIGYTKVVVNSVEVDLFALKIVCLHYMLRMESVSRANNANVLWCYKNKLELSRSVKNIAASDVEKNSSDCGKRKLTTYEDYDVFETYSQLSARIMRHGFRSIYHKLQVLTPLNLNEVVSSMFVHIERSPSRLKHHLILCGDADYFLHCFREGAVYRFSSFWKGCSWQAVSVIQAMMTYIISDASYQMALPLLLYTYCLGLTSRVYVNMMRSIELAARKLVYFFWVQAMMTYIISDASYQMALPLLLYTYCLGLTSRVYVNMMRSIELAARKLVYFFWVQEKHVRDHIIKCDIELHFIPTQYQLAHIFTKPLDKPTFKRLIVELGITAKVDSEKYVLKDSVPQQQGVDEGTNISIIDQLKAGTFSQDPKETKEPVLQHLDLHQVFNDDEAKVLQSPPSPKSTKIQELTNQLTELLVNSLKPELDKMLTSHDFSASIPMELKEHPTKVNEINRALDDLKKYVEKLEIEVPWDLKELPTNYKNLNRPSQLSLPSYQISKLKVFDAIPCILNKVATSDKFADAILVASQKVEHQSVPLAGQSGTQPAEGENNSNQATNF
nr:annexin D5-like [Tanacetum cinerariifolium]